MLTERIEHIEIELELTRSEVVKLRNENYSLKEIIRRYELEIASLKNRLALASDEE